MHHYFPTRSRLQDFHSSLVSFATLGYFSLSELQEYRELGIGIERDLYFEPTPLSKLRRN
ncbi:MAG: DUF2958 domain-containing protein (plasmid) [Nodularia sp. CChRGM 3473]